MSVLEVFGIAQSEVFSPKENFGTPRNRRVTASKGLSVFSVSGVT